MRNIIAKVTVEELQNNRSVWRAYIRYPSNPCSEIPPDSVMSIIDEAALSILQEMLPVEYYITQSPDSFRIIGPYGIDVADIFVNASGRWHCWIFWTSNYIMIELCNPNCFQPILDAILQKY